MDYVAALGRRFSSQAIQIGDVLTVTVAAGMLSFYLLILMK